MMGTDQAAKDPQQILTTLAGLSMGSSAIEAVAQEMRQWRGFTVQLERLNLVFPFAGGFEILTEREIHPVPWTHKWIRGVTNVRGEVHTVVDFADYLGMKPVESLRRATLFKLPDSRLKSSLLMQSRVNLRSFPEFLQHDEAVDIPARLSHSVSAVLKHNDESWVVVDVMALCRDPEFTVIGQAAVLH